MTTTTPTNNNSENNSSESMILENPEIRTTENVVISDDDGSVVRSSLLQEYLTNPNKKKKRKRVNLNVKQKLELIDKLELGISVKQVCTEYGIKRQTVSDIRKKKNELRQFVAKYTTNLFIQRQLTTTTTTPNISGICKRKHMKVARDNAFENAIYQWYITQITNGNKIKSSDIRNMACKIAADMNLYDFKASDGWLWRFRNRLGIVKTKQMNKNHQQSHDNNSLTNNLEPFEFISVDNNNKTNDNLDLHQDIKQEYHHDPDDDYSVDISRIKRDIDGESILMDIPQIKQHIDIILDYIVKSSDTDLQPYLLQFSNFRKMLSKKQYCCNNNV